MNKLKDIALVFLSLTFGNVYSQKDSILNNNIQTKNNIKINTLTTNLVNTKNNLNIKEYAKYNLPIDQERLNTQGLYGYNVPTVYTDTKVFGNGTFGIAAFAEWYKDDEETPVIRNIDQNKIDEEYYQIYGEKKYLYTIYNGGYLDYYVNNKTTISLQIDMYPYSPKIYFPDHFGAWLYLTKKF